MGCRLPIPADCQAVCDRVGCNVFGRLAHVTALVKANRDAQVRREMLALLKFYPPKKPRARRERTDMGDAIGMRGYR